MSANTVPHFFNDRHESDYKWQTSESGQTKKRRNRNRRRSQNRQRTTSVSSREGHRESHRESYREGHRDGLREGQREGPREGQRGGQRDSQRDSQREGQRASRNDRYYDNYRQRAESNVSIGGRSAVSVMTNESRSNRGSLIGSDYKPGFGQRNLRWDRDRIWNHYLTHSQTKDMLTRKNRLKDALHKILTSNFLDYDVSLYIVGSSATGLANNHSDVDICIVMNEIDQKSSTEEEKAKDSTVSNELLDLTPETKEDKPEDNEKDKTETESELIADTGDIDSANESLESIGITSNGKSDLSVPMLEKIEKVLKNYNFVTKLQIILAKVPILKFNDRISGIEVTLNVNKLVSIRNTLLIHDYTKMDWRVQPLMLVIKAWAKDHNIKDAYNRSISSYSLVLMVIHYLQYACDPPVLPCLQKLDAKRYNPSADIRTIRMESRPKRWESYNESSLKELLIGFLDYYSYSFCFSKDAISVRLGHPLPKHVVQRYKTDDNCFSHWKYLSIEEPFNRSNTARSVYDQVMFEHILSVFRVSHYTLRRYPFLDSIMAGKQFSNDYMLKPTTSITSLPAANYEPYLNDTLIKTRTRLNSSSSIN